MAEGKASFGSPLWEGGPRVADAQRQAYVEYLRAGGMPDPSMGGLGDADPGAVGWVQREGANRVKLINETTRAGIRDLVEQGIRDGVSPAEMGDRIQAWSGFDEYRAERIARTELMFAYNGSALRTYGENGVTSVQAVDGDDDAECRDRDGKVFPVSEAQTIYDHPNGTLDWLPVMTDLAGPTQPIQAPPPPIPRGIPDQQTIMPRNETWADMTRADAEDALHRGRATLEELLEQRHGVKVVRESGNPFGLGHDRATFRAFEDFREAGGKPQLERFVYSSKRSQKAAADYGRAHHHTRPAELGRPSELVQHDEITIYRDTARNLNQHYGGYVRGRAAEGVDDFTSTVQHELGHAMDFRAFGKPNAHQLHQMFANIHDAAAFNKDLKRLSSQLSNTRTLIKRTREKIQARLDAGYEEAGIRTMRAELESFERMERMLVEMRTQMKAKKVVWEARPTEYAGTNEYEDFAESWWFWVYQRDVLRRDYPQRYEAMKAFVENIL